MKNAMSIAVVLSLCFIVVGWAAWTGYVTYDGDGYEGADVESVPADGYTHSLNNGYYSLNQTNGMEEDKYYDQVKAYALIGEIWHNGYHNVQDIYDSDVWKYNLNINLSPFYDK